MKCILNGRKILLGDVFYWRDSRGMILVIRRFSDAKDILSIDQSKLAWHVYIKDEVGRQDTAAIR